MSQSLWVFVHFLLVFVILIVTSGGINCLESHVTKMTCYVSSRILTRVANMAHELHLARRCILTQPPHKKVAHCCIRIGVAVIELGIQLRLSV